jgi:hypothetical protein
MLLGVVAVQPFPALAAVLPCGVPVAARGPVALRITPPARTLARRSDARLEDLTPSAVVSGAVVLLSQLLHPPNTLLRFVGSLVTHRTQS